MKRFRVQRSKDISGVSGTGYVAEGIMFRSGQCAVCWRSNHSSINIYKSIEDVTFVHGHGGSTSIVFIDSIDDPEKMDDCLEANHSNEASSSHTSSDFALGNEEDCD